jgi:hypothetical protein
VPEAVVKVAEVSATKTRNGNTRFVLRADDGKEYTTFREEIARQALAAEGKRARVGTKPAKPVEPDELFERLQPLKDLVAEDIREDGEEA